MSFQTLLFIIIGFTLGILTGLSDATAAEKSAVKRYCNDNMVAIDSAELSTKLATDHIVVSKKRRKIYLMNKGAIVKSYDVAFGFGSNNGAKAKRGDGRTPEGMYFVEMKNMNSKYHRALRVSYPNSADINNAKNLGVHPGGDIMIHGFPVGFIDGLDPSVIERQHPLEDWTQGCIAVTDAEIEEIFSYVSVKTPIEICPL